MSELGTISLDEIGDMAPAMQAKMLRVIEYKEIERLGSEKTVPLDVRIITATNKDLTKMVEEGTFREDLYYRINVVTIDMPPLKDRLGDVLLLAEKFLKDFSNKLGKKISGFTPDAASALTTYHWPGNVRELQNVIERGVVLTRSDLISMKELPGLSDTNSDLGQFDKMSDVEKFHIKKILDRMGGNIGKSADVLGIHRNTLRTKIKEYELSE